MKISLISFCTPAKIFETITRETRGEVLVCNGNFGLISSVNSRVLVDFRRLARANSKMRVRIPFAFWIFASPKDKFWKISCFACATMNWSGKFTSASVAFPTIATFTLFAR